MLPKTNILTTHVTNATEKEILEYIFEKVKKKEKPFIVVTPNPEMVMFGQKNHEFQEILNNAEIASIDGVGLLLAAEILGQKLHGRVTGTDLMESICKMASEESKKDVRNPITVGFLGAKENVAKRTAECLQQRYPGLAVAFAEKEWPGHPASCRTEHTRKEEMHDVPHIDILFVAFGVPKQEFWVKNHKGILPVTCMMTVGGAFDYLSGEVRRAPFLIRAVGLEWFFRLVRQPWRLKRQLALISFMALVFRERFLKSSS